MSKGRAIGKPVKPLPLGKSAPSQSTSTAGTKAYEGYCVKCKDKRVFQGRVELSKAKTPMEMAKGTCPNCGTKMCRILGKANV